MVTSYDIPGAFIKSFDVSCDNTIRNKYVSYTMFNFLFILSSLTILYIPLGIIVIVRNKERISVEAVFFLAVLPIVRGLLTYTVCFGFCKGKWA